MLSPEAKLAVERSTPARRVSLIVTVNPDDELRKVRAIEDRKTRSTKLTAFYERKKQPLLKRILSYEHAGLRVVNSLSGTPNLIVSAPARVWKRVIRDHAQLVMSDTFEIQANEPDFVSSDVTAEHVPVPA